VRKEKPKPALEREFIPRVRTVLSPLPSFDHSDRRHIGIPDPKRTPAAGEEILQRTPILHHKKFSTEGIYFPSTLIH
jgi:hypothetical protein